MEVGVQMTQQEAIEKSLALEREMEDLRQQLFIYPDPELVKEVKKQIKEVKETWKDGDDKIKWIETLNASIRRKRIDPEKAELINDKINKLQKESDELWEYAKSLNPIKEVKKCYENLANAVVKQAVFDYEALISGTMLPGNDCNVQEILAFAKETNYTGVDLHDLLMKIKSDRQHKFIPYVRKNKDKIIKMYKTFKKNRVDTVSYNSTFPYRCAMCGGALIPKFLKSDDTSVESIGCTNCRTAVLIKDL